MQPIYDQNQINYTQQTYDQSQMNYAQQTYDQSQMNYAQQTYDQSQMNYVQQTYDQSQINYTQPMYNQSQVNYMPSQPQADSNKNKHIKNICLIVVAVIFIALLASIFIPMLFKSKDPFANINPGDSLEKTMKRYDFTEDDISHNMVSMDLEGFGIVGSAQICLSKDRLDHVNWYVREDDCKDRDHYYDVLEEVKDYYTDEYGAPEDVEEQGSDEKLVWRSGPNSEIALATHGNKFILRYRKISKY